jgi:hypothetical protein
MIFLLLLLLLGPLEIHAQAATPAKSQPPATILIIRHAEKLTDGRIDLSPTGFERAKLLPRLFSTAGARPDRPAPQVLFATHLSAHSNRPVQTVTPLAAALHLPIHESFSNEDYSALAAALLSGKYGGEIVLVGLASQQNSATRLRPRSNAPRTLHGQTPSSTASGTAMASRSSRICPTASCRETQNNHFLPLS